MKFETEIDFTNGNQIEPQIRLYDNIQDGGDRHLGNRKSVVTFEPFNQFAPYLTRKKHR